MSKIMLALISKKINQKKACKDLPSNFHKNIATKILKDPMLKNQMKIHCCTLHGLQSLNEARVHHFNYEKSPKTIYIKRVGKD